MSVYNTIMERKSIRKFSDRKIGKKELERLLHAAMAGPCCVNARDWSFLVVTDPEMLGRMADANGGPAEPLRRAAAGVLIMGDLNRAFPPAKDYWVIDGAIAGQNLILAAWEQGIGSVWLGTWPQMERVEAQRQLFDLPDSLVPHSVIALGYPEKDGERKSEEEQLGLWEPSRIHWEKF